MAKKNVPAIVSALGVLTAIITSLVAAVRKHGGDAEDIHRLATPDGELLLDEFARRIVEAGRIVKLFRPREYFVTRPGLSIWNELFTREILSVAKPGVSLASVGEPFVLDRPMCDAGIRGELRRERLGDGDIFENAGAFCAALAGMIDRQDDKFPVGCANVFYVRGASDKVFVVVINRKTNHWDIRTVSQSNSERWIAGTRAFPCN